ncbi:MAG: NADH-ubiquinone oxidoreductase chain B, partial [uncultured Blastococcus sp.]
GTRGEAAERRAADQRGEAGQLDPQVVAVAGDVRSGLLRHRDDGLRDRPVRPGPVRHGGVPRLAAAGRPDDRGRTGEPEDGPGPAPDLRPDARAALGAGHGRLCQLRRHVQQLCDRPGRRPRRPGGHVPARLPTAAGDAHGRDPQAAPQDPARAPGGQARASAGAGPRGRHREGPARRDALDRARGQERPARLRGRRRGRSRRAVPHRAAGRQRGPAARGARTM